jgi:uncharacterized protein
VSDEWRGPSPSYLRLRRAEVAVATIACASAAAVTAGILASVPIASACVAVVAVAGVIALITVQRRFAAWGYAERGDDLLVKRGVLFARLSVIPYGRMQFVDVTASPLERLVGIATVRMHTAAAATDARIPGLASAEAARLRDKLAELGEAQAAGL